tara:strand:- start:162 stop:494 length:333 start_codon:yes stop_codon:yes gene_type:complete
MTEFTNVIDVEKEYSRSEMGKILTQIYHEITKGKKPATDKPKKPRKSKKNSDDEEEPKKKREPTHYNIFVKEQMPLIKEEFPELSRQDLMRKVGELWKMKKESEKEGIGN